MSTRRIVRGVVLAGVVVVGTVFVSARFGAQAKAQPQQPTTQAKAQPQQPTAQPQQAKAQTQQATVAEAEAANKKLEADNAKVALDFKTGNTYLQAGQFAESITAFRAGLQTRADEPALLTNLSEALRRRGLKHWSDGAKAVEPESKTRSQDLAKKDWLEAAVQAQKALLAIKQRESSLPRQPIDPQTKLGAAATRATAMRLVATRVDRSQVDASWQAYAENIALENDAGRKSKLKGEALQMLFEAEANAQAIVRSRALLKEEPEHLDAQRVLGLALFTSTDKTMFREAAGLLQNYLDKAPETDPWKEPTREAFAFLKTMM